MDLNDIKAVEQEVEILSPRTKKPTGLVFIVNSVQSDEVQKVVRERNDAIIARRDVPDASTHGMNILRAAIVGWRWDGDATFEGEKLEFTPENVKRVLNSDAGKKFIAPQLTAVVSDVDRFFTI